MKDLITALGTFILFALASCLSIRAQSSVGGNVLVSGATAGGFTLEDSNTGSADGGYQVANNSSSLYRATEWTATNTYTLTKIEVFLYAAGTPASNTQTLTAEIYVNDPVGPPNLPVNTGALATSTNTVAGSTVTATTAGTADTITFNFSGVSITNTNIYWVCVFSDGADATNYTWWVRHDTGNGVAQDLDGVSWSSTIATRHLKFNAYSGS